MALVSPGGGAGGPELVGLVSGQEFGGCDHAECFLVVGGLAEEGVEEKRALVPPVSVQFGIVGANDDRLDPHDAVEMLDLFFPVEHEVGGVLIGAFTGEGRPVRLLVLGAAGDAMIFKAGEFSSSAGLDVGADVVVIEIEADVPIKVPVFGVSRIALLGAPNLLAGFNVPTERSGACGGKEGGEYAVSGTGFGVKDAVSIDDEPANLGLLEMVFDPGNIGAFGKPDPPGIPTKTVSVIVSGNLNLGADRLGKIHHQGEKAMGGSAGDYLKNTRVLKFSKGADQVATVAITEKMAAVVKPVVIEAGEGLKGGIVPGAVKLLVGELDLFFQPVDVTILKQGIPEHGAQGRGQRHGESEGNAVADETLHHIQEGQIGFGDRLVQPILLEKLGIFGMAHEGKVGVEDGGYVTEGHGLGLCVRRREGGCRGRFRGGGWSRALGRFRSGGEGARSWQRSRSCGGEENHR